MPRENFAKLPLKACFLCILEASFSIMLLRDLLEEGNRKVKIKHRTKSVYFKLRRRFPFENWSVT